ncbi:23S rRNA (adenine(2503)-C(2))-methyltransferase RlmN [Chondromyces apiculatus]|nr:23S rRNA (adenine(2503)-C(2))-methyltransferase RlmN [Chondromyces apiculatus]
MSRKANAGPLLADHDAASLEALLVRAGGTPSAARSAAGRVVRHVFRNGASKLQSTEAGSTEEGSPEGVGAEGVSAEAPWDRAALAALGIGAWAHEALLSLQVGVSLSVAEVVPAGDATLRLALRARDGALLESVLIPGPGRTTLCVSSQVGCARACAFCETGRLGLTRQLSAGEMVDQVRIAQALWRAAPGGGGGGKPALSNLVFMGMGEPFDNLGEVGRAIRLLTDGRALGFAQSRVTVSTVGVADKIEAFFQGVPAELAVSLNAPDDARRQAIMPINTRFPLAVLREALLRALPPGRRVLFEYVLFDGFNDAPEDADLLAALVSGIRCRVNVIPCNPGPDPRLRPPSQERLDAFVARLSGLGVTTLVRRPRGRDVGGACGQLAGLLRQQAEQAAVA